MASWAQLEREAPDLSALARRYLDAFAHKTLATLRRDGSPRISGTELAFGDGEAWLGSMWLAVKALDLRRDPRFALHSGSASPPDWTGDAKIAGRAIEVVDGRRTAETSEAEPSAGRSHRFRLDVSELVVVHLGDPADHLLIESWHEGRGLSTQRR